MYPRLVPFFMLALFCAACTEEAPSTNVITCAVRGEGPATWRSPVELTVKGESLHGVDVYARSLYGRAVTAAKVTNGVVTAHFEPIPPGEVRFFVAPAGTTNPSVGKHGGDCGTVRVSPGYPQEIAIPELTGIELRAVSADVDSDGDPDVVTSTGLLLLNDGQASFTSMAIFSQAKDRLSVAEIDGVDGLDIIAWNRRGGRPISEAYVLLAQPDGSYVHRDDLRKTFLTGSYGEAAVGDIDGDGYAEAVTVSEEGLWVRWNDRGTWLPAVRVDEGISSVERGFGSGELADVYFSTIELMDADRDGKVDVVYGRTAIAYQRDNRSFETHAERYTLTEECRKYGSSCPRIVGFHLFGETGVFMSVAYGVNQFMEGVSVVEPATDGTWFSNSDADGDGLRDLIGFGILTGTQGVGYLSGAENPVSPLDNLFGEPSLGEVGAVFFDRFDKRNNWPQWLVVHGFGGMVIYRQDPIE